MLFNSLTFILFFSIVFFLHNFPFSWKVKKFNLLIASYIFYAVWNPPFVILLWIVTLIDWFVAKWIAKTEVKSKRKALLILSLVSNLGILSYFKYGEFLLTNFVYLLQTVGVQYQPPELGIILPIGISFYTFVTLSYTIDIYRKKIKPAKSFLDYALLVTFFPHLLAGPILRARQFIPQCLTPKKANPQQLGWGFFLMVLGLFEKVVLADGILAPVVNSVYEVKVNVGWSQAWLATYAFGTQIYFDFNGYSLCAIGCAMCLGFVFPDNFRFPFASIGFLDLWRRWHITLSAWFRDYFYVPLSFWLRENVYKPLTGRQKSNLFTAINLTIVMAVIGLWHGAAWHFIIWGTLQGILMGIERTLQNSFLGFKKFYTSKYKVFSMILSFTLFNVVAIFFRSAGTENALKMIRALFSSNFINVDLYTSEQALAAIIVIIGGVFVHWRLRDSSIEEGVGKLPDFVKIVLIAIMILAIILYPVRNNAFIYFQF